MGLRERYQTDSHFRALVDTFQALIHQAQFTPTEIREAAMLAQIMYESIHPRPVFFTRSDVLDGKV